MQNTTPLFYRSGRAVTDTLATTEILRGACTVTIRESDSCNRCGGSGYISSYKYIEGGRCFQCGGAVTHNRTKIVEHRVYTADRLASLVASKAKKDAAKAEKARIRFEREEAEVLEEKSDLLSRFDSLAPEFKDVAEQDIAKAERDADSSYQRGSSYEVSYGLCADAFFAACNRVLLAKWLTEKRVAAMEKRIAGVRSRKVELENVQALTEGRKKLSGKVLSVKWVESQWGGTEKMLLALPDGNRVFGSVPSSVEVSVGDEVELTATVKVSDRDTHLGFFSRPSKASVLASV